MARSDAIREQILALTNEGDRLLAASPNDPAAQARVDTILGQIPGLESAYHTARATELSARPARGPVPAGMVELPNGQPPMRGAGSPGGQAPRRSYHGVSWGDAVLESVTNGGRFNAAALTGGSTAVSVPLNPNPVRIGYRTEFLRSLIPAEDAPGGQFSYLQQTVRTNNAAVVAPGALKPQSVHTLARINDRTRMVATLSEPVNRVDLDDAPLIRSFLDSELNLDLDLATDDAILNGLGTGELIKGIYNQSGVQTQAFATDIITTIRKALTKLRVSELVPDGIVVTPGTWETVELAAMASFAAKDAIRTPVDAMAQTLFGIPVVQSTAVPAATCVVGAWGSSSILYTTGGVQIDWSQETYDKDALGAGVGASDFQRNLIRFRAEQRVQVAWTRPAGFVLTTLA